MKSTKNTAGIVVALCAGHRCAALIKASDDDGGLAAAVARSSGGVLISASCLQQCAHGAVAAVALRASMTDLTGPSVWLGGLEAPGRLRALGAWVERWRPQEERPSALPHELSQAVLGTGAPVRLTANQA
ncbi:hypothetical protein [Arthrobacter flavus]|uniref:Metal-binding protein n=1 Tax=Arthrobacter flavus TaxID=95172 RepID=A0ABW4Q3H8_9MICC